MNQYRSVTRPLKTVLFVTHLLARWFPFQGLQELLLLHLLQPVQLTWLLHLGFPINVYSDVYAIILHIYHSLFNVIISLLHSKRCTVI